MIIVKLLGARNISKYFGVSMSKENEQVRSVMCQTWTEKTKTMIVPLQLNAYSHMITCLEGNLAIKNMSFCGPGVEWEAIFWIIGIP